jgi:hypothetical protein
MPRFPTPDAGPIPRERIRYLAGKIHPLGERPLGEIFLELNRGDELGSVLERYARLEPLANFIRAHGGNRLAEPRLVPCSNTRE